MSDTGVGELVLEKKPRGSGKKGASGGSGRKRKAAASNESSDESEFDEHTQTVTKGQKGKPKKKAKGEDAGDAASSPAKAKKGASSVDHSKPLSAIEELHEEYMKKSVKELNDILNINLISAPKDKKKNALAWQCVYGEILGAPVGKCPRCLHGKLKPNLKPEQLGQPIEKGKVKWKCPGYFDSETDSIKFCNKTFATDGSEVATRPFKGLHGITDEDVKEMEDRKALERQEREAIHAERLSHMSEDERSSPHPFAQHHRHPGDDRPEAVIHGKGAPRLADENAFPDFISDPHSSASSAAPNAPHVHKSPAADPSEVLATHHHEHDAPHLPSEREKRAAAAQEAGEKGGEAESQAGGSSSKPMCQYGATCYRKSEEHKRQFAHPENKEAKTYAGE